MMTLSRFNELAAAGYTHIPVFRQRLADTDTPLAVFARLREHAPAYLFESVQGGERWGRYSMIGLGAGVILQYQQGCMTEQTVSGAIVEHACADPFAFIRSFQQRYRLPTQVDIPDLAGFSGGLIGYFGYDSVRYIEPKLSHVPASDPIGLPDIWLTLSQTVVVFDNLRGGSFCYRQYLFNPSQHKSRYNEHQVDNNFIHQIFTATRFSSFLMNVNECFQ